MEDLSDSQRAMIARALEDLQRRRFDIMKKIVEEQIEFDRVVISRPSNFLSEFYKLYFHYRLVRIFIAIYC